MYLHSVFEIVMGAGTSIAHLTVEMEDEAELFASHLTLHAIEDRLLVMAVTLAHVPPVLHQALVEVDWAGCATLHDTLRAGQHPRWEEIWYAIHALVPQTLELLAALRLRQPNWFAIRY